MAHFYSQRGSMLLECLVGISIFSFGVLAITALQGNAMRHASSSSSRTTATQLMQRLDGEMRSNVGNLDDFKMSKANCKTAKSTVKAGSAKKWASAVAENLGIDDATCSVEIQGNNATTPCSRRAIVTISWPTARGAKSGVATGANQGLNEAVNISDIQTILEETNDPLDQRALRCGL
jgi:type IV pilus assembly protein PilV